jgi:mannose-6-phosphate isomerase
MELCPLVFQPRLVNKLWGGRRLESLGKSLPPGEAVGESWEIFDDADGSAVVSSGPAQGRSLRELSLLWGEALCGQGRESWARRFPLLIKLLDASADLSVQVHPDDSLARVLEGPGAIGKSEVFVVLQAEPGACMYSGWKAGVDQEAVRAAVSAGNLEELLNRLEISAGDVMDIPAGRPHAIGAGCLVAEVQQNCELTYRLWDWGRLEAGKPRDLHLEQALRALRFDQPFASDNGLRTPRGLNRGFALDEALMEGPYFSLRRLTLRGAAPFAPAGVPRILMALGGLRLAWSAGEGMIVPPGSTALLPAGLDARVMPAEAGAQTLWIEPR